MMKRQFAALLAATALTLTLAACANAPKDTSVPELTFEQVQKVSLNVAKIEVYDEYDAPGVKPNVEHTLKNPIDISVQRLIEKQLSADGTENVLRAIIEDASVVEEKLVLPKGVISAFRWDPEFRYNARVVVRFELVNENAPDIVKGSARVTANRSATATENLSLAERDRMFFSITENMMKDVSDGLQTIVAGTFGKY
jgi:hypothetical protein